MQALGWIALGVAGWIVVGGAVALLIARVIGHRGRDEPPHR
ncbi:hypothetical protein [Microbacterium sp. Root61]|nr:hypothetical protein [Microbacterium sp. Root61]